MSASSSVPATGFFGRISNWWYGEPNQPSSAPVQQQDAVVQDVAQSVLTVEENKIEKKGADLPRLFCRSGRFYVKDLGVENTLGELITEVAKKFETTVDKVHIIFLGHELDVKNRPELLELSINAAAKTISHWGLVPNSLLGVILR